MGLIAFTRTGSAIPLRFYMFSIPLSPLAPVARRCWAPVTAACPVRQERRDARDKAEEERLEQEAVRDSEAIQSAGVSPLKRGESSLSRRGCSCPATASGLDAHRASIN
jgi:hypothetical protein